MNVSPKGWKFQTLHPIWNSENQMSESEVHPVDIKQRAMLLASHKGAVTAQSTIPVLHASLFQDLQNHLATVCLFEMGVEKPKSKSTKIWLIRGGFREN